MSTYQIENDLPSGKDADWLETQFFSQTSLRNHDLDWGPVTPMPHGARRATLATIGLVTAGVVGFAAFLVYATLIMPVPERIGVVEPPLPPPAASQHTPNG